VKRFTDRGAPPGGRWLQAGGSAQNRGSRGRGSWSRQKVGGRGERSPGGQKVAGRGERSPGGQNGPGHGSGSWTGLRGSRGRRSWTMADGDHQGRGR
jgi:hypothetical protein